MAIRFKSRGMGATPYSSAADLAANPYINCSGAAQYLDPFCWSIWQGTAYGSNYPAPPMPPTVGSTLPDGSPIPVVPPVLESPQLTAVNASQIAGSISDQQISDTQAQNQGFFADLNASLNSPGAGINWWLIGGLAAGVLAIGTFVGGGSPRRYGR